MKRSRVALLVAAVILAAVGSLIALLPQAAGAEGQTSTPLSTVNSDTQETSFGDLATDAIRDASGANIAFIGAITFKAGSLGVGLLTVDRISSLLGNPEEVWAVSRLKGSQIRGALEHSVHSAPLPNNAFLQVSGLTFEYSASAARGQRVKSIRVGPADLSDAADYTIAMPLSLAKGGSGYFRFFTKEAIEKEGTNGLAATIVAYAERRGSVSYSGFGRITAQP